MSDHFGTLCIKGLNTFNIEKTTCNSKLNSLNLTLIQVNCHRKFRKVLKKRKDRDFKWIGKMDKLMISHIKLSL